MYELEMSIIRLHQRDLFSDAQTIPENAAMSLDLRGVKLREKRLFLILFVVLSLLPCALFGQSWRSESELVV